MEAYLLRGPRDHTERLHVLTSVIIKPVNGAARNAQRLPRPTLTCFPLTVQVNTAVPIPCYLFSGLVSASAFSACPKLFRPLCGDRIGLRGKHLAASHERMLDSDVLDFVLWACERITIDDDQVRGFPGF